MCVCVRTCMRACVCVCVCACVCTGMFADGCVHANETKALLLPSQGWSWAFFFGTCCSRNSSGDHNQLCTRHWGVGSGF